MNYYSEYKVEVIKEGAIGTLLLGASGLPIKKLEQRLNACAQEGWQVVFQVIEQKRFLLFWTREAILLTLGKPDRNYTAQLSQQAYKPENTAAYKLGTMVGGIGKQQQTQEPIDDFAFEEIPTEKPAVVALPQDPERHDVMKAQCGECNKIMTYPNKMTGKIVKCPGCKQEFELP